MAAFQKSKTGFFSTSQPASLTVAPHAKHILDEVVTTFVWFEGKRRQKAGSRRNVAITAAAAS
jgi:hypothetical protein